MNDLVSSMVTFHRNEGVAIGVSQARKEGFKEGFKEGYKEGYKEGFKEGYEEGRMEERKATEQRLKRAARLMSRRDVSNDQIALILSLDQATVDEWLDEERP